MSVSDEFCKKAVELVDRCAPLVQVSPHRKQSGLRPLNDVEHAKLVLAQTAVRLAFLGFLQVRGWLSVGGRTDYLFALYDDWVAQPGAYRFKQLLAMVYTNGLSQPSRNARRLVERRIGSVPYLSPPLLRSEDFERDFLVDGGVVVIPAEFWAGLVAEGGLFRNGVVVSMNPGCDQLNPDCLGKFAFLIQGRSDSDGYEASVATKVAAHLELVKSKIRGLSLAESLQRVSSLKMVDPACGPGSVLVQTVRQVMALVEDIATEQGEKLDRSLTVRRIVKKGIHGMDQVPLFVEVTRLRLALEMIRFDPLPTPLPDLTRDVEVGEGVSVVTPFVPSKALPPEAARVEYKSTFEWDSRRNQKSPELMLGCLRTVCAFLNSEGGDLYIGVGDDGTVKGIDDDFALIKDSAKEDMFENRLREFFKNHIEPIPLNAVEVTFMDMDGRKVCRLAVKPRPEEVTYLVFKDASSGQPVEEIFVRDGNRTLCLKGRKRDQFVVSRLSR